MPERRKIKTLKGSKGGAVKKVKAKAKAKPVKALKAKKSAASTKESSAKAAASKSDSVSVFDQSGKTLESLKLDAMFVDGSVNTDVIYQAILMYQAGEREGTAATKDRGHVRGGGKKPWKQKGTGQARHGSRRSPLWTGGGVTFGPMPRDYSYAIPREIRRRAVAESVKHKVHSGKLVVLSDLKLDAPKTRLVAGLMDKFKLEKPLLVVDEKTDNLMMASRNIRQVSVKTALEMNALDVATHHECVMTKAAYSGLLKRLKS